MPRDLRFPKPRSCIGSAVPTRPWIPPVCLGTERVTQGLANCKVQEMCGFLEVRATGCSCESLAT